MPTSAHETLRALNARFIHNFVTNDVASHDAILHPDFVTIQSNGTRQTRKDYLVRWASGFDPGVIIYWDTRDEHIAIFGAVALVSATNKHTVRRDGRDETGMTAYTDTYFLENGQWRCIQAQLTPVATGQGPSDDTIVNVYIRGQKQ